MSTEKNTEIHMDGAEWATILTFAAKDAEGDLNQVAIYSDGTVAATDGHRLVMRLAPGGDPAADRGKPVCVSHECATVLKKMAGAKGTIRLRAEDDRVHCKAGDGGILFAATKKVFPPLHAVAKTPEHGWRDGSPAVFAVDARLLGDTMDALAKMHSAAKTKGAWAVQIRAWGELEPVHLVCAGRDCEWFAVVMPCRL